MSQVFVKHFRVGMQPVRYSLFVLSKGENAGKPLREPCPNCFSLVARSRADREKIYWIFYGLWQVGYFKMFLVGSVIPFLRIVDLKTIVIRFCDQSVLNNDITLRALKNIIKLERLHSRLDHQMKIVCQVRRLVTVRLIKGLEN